MDAGHLRIGIDIGGTFTDFAIYEAALGSLRTFKRLSTPHDPAEAVLEGLAELLGAPAREVSITHGSTVATNALLERKGASTAFVATRGFKDILEIGRQNRPSLYDLFADPPRPLIPKELRFEIDERVDSAGRVLIPLDSGQLDALVSGLEAARARSVAVCLLFSFLHPEHERLVAERLRRAGFFVSASAEILPEFREYERASTTAVNAYVSPVLDGYLARLEEARPAGDLPVRWRMMQSNGGSISLEEARQAGVRCILSGPAGGLVGARYVAERALANDSLDLPPSGEAGSPPGALGQPRRLQVITFDMGGTSTDVSLIDGGPVVTAEAAVGGFPIRIPILDIHTIGAGGGSIAGVDPGGALRVGPQSAGAFPGPACYGRAGPAESLPTVTDANLVLGRISAEHFLGGRMRLDADLAHAALARLGEAMGLEARQAALGVVEVANAHMERALRLISVERGHDPRDFTLLSFGGAGGLHAADLARRLGIPRLIVPPLASTLSAFGMLVAEVVKDYTQTVMLPGDASSARLEAALEPIVRRGVAEVLAEGLPPQAIAVERMLDVRYHGQSYELTVPFSERLIPDFHAAHRRMYGYERPQAPLEIVNLRVRVTGHRAPPPLEALPFAGPDPRPAQLDIRPVVFPAGTQPTPFFRGENLQPGNRLEGPAVVVRDDTTILIGPTDLAAVDGYGNLILAVGG